MPTITNKHGDYTTFALGGIGGDNVLGAVYHKEGNPVDKAKVRLKDMNNDEKAECVTGKKGWYDEDLNAESGHRIDVDISWVDTNNNVTYTIKGQRTI